MTLRVSVVMPSYERPAMLQRCLAALAAQTLGGDEYEIVVVHDGPSDAARAIHSTVCRSRRPPGFSLRFGSRL